jgi:proteic killer suppression protein
MELPETENKKIPTYHLKYTVKRYIIYRMIKTFRCKKTEKLFEDRFVQEFSSFQQQARKKLLMLNAAKMLKDLEVPPENRLEKLVGNRSGQHSIRINSQWRICFNWNNGSATNVEIVDYH